MATRILTQGTTTIDRIVLVAMTAILAISVGEYMHALALPAHFV